MVREPWSRPTTAGRLAFGWSLFLSLAGLVLLVALPGMLQSAESGYCENDDHPGPCTSQAEWWLVPGLVVLAVAAWCLVASVGLLKHRRWARWAVAVTFSFWAIGALGALVAAVTSSDGAGPVAIIWLALLGYFATTVVLAVAGPTGGGIDPPTGAP